MIDQKNHAPRRYFVDGQGHRVLIGLSQAETTEFEALDLSTVGAGAAAVNGTLHAEDIRWVELYFKHEEAWRTWLAQSRAEQTRSFSLY